MLCNSGNRDYIRSVNTQKTCSRTKAVRRADINRRLATYLLHRCVSYLISVPKAERALTFGNLKCSNNSLKRKELCKVANRFFKKSSTELAKQFAVKVFSNTPFQPDFQILFRSIL